MRLYPLSVMFLLHKVAKPRLPILKMTAPSSSASAAASNATINRALFEKVECLLGLNIPAKLCSQSKSALKDYVLDRPRTKAIYDVGEDKSRKLLLLSEAVLANALLANGGTTNDPDALRELLPPPVMDYLEKSGASLQYYTLKTGYLDTPMDEILRALLPDSISEIPSAFEQVGSLAHLNLRDEALPFKHIIGQVILDKVPAIKTVVTKVGTIETEFRTFPMELIAGDANYDVQLKESGARFHFNFNEVYWNSRLQTEHARIIEIVAATWATDKRRVAVDMMAGIGPFAVPLAMRGLSVFANDLNPASYKYLTANSQLNSCQKRLQAYNMDGRDFVIMLAEQGVAFDEVMMNLPASAVEFLDVFIGLGARYASFDYSRLPRVHVYAFSSAEDVVADVAGMVAAHLRCDLAALRFEGSARSAEAAKIAAADGRLLEVPCWGHVVRDVSPKKMMVCLSFTLPESVARAQPVVTRKRSAPEATSVHSDKRSKL